MAVAEFNDIYLQPLLDKLANEKKKMPFLWMISMWICYIMKLIA